MSNKKLAKDFVIMMWKIIASHTQLACYFFMLLATITNGGLIYMIYPFMIFGSAMMEESRPGMKFWYLVIIYTQIIIFCQFFVQLNFWHITNTSSVEHKLFQWQKNHNIGLIHIKESQYGFATVLNYFYCEILILAFVLIHIQQETLAGLFDINLEE